MDEISRYAPNVRDAFANIFYPVVNRSMFNVHYYHGFSISSALVGLLAEMVLIDAFVGDPEYQQCAQKAEEGCED